MNLGQNIELIEEWKRENKIEKFYYRYNKGTFSCQIDIKVRWQDLLIKKQDS